MSGATAEGRRGHSPLSLVSIFMALIICCAPAALPSASRAAVQLPEEEVVSSVIYDEDEDKYLSPGMVTVIRPEERAGEQRTLSDLLQEAPGIRVIRLQGRHGYSVASVRGSTSAQVAVYVDGVLMNLRSESAVDLSAIPADEVERIEVYRGYIPAQFGAQAMGGVINIVTKFPDRPETNVSLGTGSFGRYRGTLSHSARLGDGKFFGSFGYETYDGDFEYWNDNGTPYDTGDDYTGKRRGNGFENTDLMLKWQDDNWSVRGSWMRRNRDLAISAPGIDRPGVKFAPSALLDTERWDLSVGRQQSSGPVNWGWEAFYTKNEKEYDRRSEISTGFGSDSVRKSEYDSSRAGISLNANMPIGERHFLELLAEYSDERLDVAGGMVGAHLNGISRYDMADWNLNIQDTIALDRAGAFLVTPSIRWHKMDDDDRFTWQVAVTKEFSSAWMLKGAYGTYARAPNMYERYGDGAFILPAPSGLRWESGTQFDLGVIWNGTASPLRSARSNISLSAFWRDTENLIEFIMENERRSWYENIAESEVKGVELEAAFDWERWNLALSGTWMDAINKTPGDSGGVRFNGKRLPNRPEWSGNARLTRRFGRGSAFVEYQYIGENYVDSSEKVLFDARSVVNLGVKYDLSPTTQLIAGVDDVFNEADEWRMHPDDGVNGPTRMLWYPVEGRAYYMTLNMEF
ncbi:MAG: TonB-dependent receptor [Synergistaceae bacterium]|jgi:outer membrane cobalamin receptor|nr:TonB-dependent receptor [Synergistaceae bacterium]